MCTKRYNPFFNESSLLTLKNVITAGYTCHIEDIKTIFASENGNFSWYTF